MEKIYHTFKFRILPILMGKKKNAKKRLIAYSSFLVMGDYSYGHPEVKVWPGNNKKVYIGKFCSISSGVKIFTGGEHNTKWITTYPIRIRFDLEDKYKDGHPVTKGDVFIGNDVWIGMDVTILSGVKIGDGAVIGANSLISMDVPPYTIVGGNPAQVLKKRFSDDQIEKLLKIKWWDWEISKIIKNVSLLCQENIDLFIKKFYKQENH